MIYNIKLTTLSPVHIGGSNEEITSSGYFYNNGNLYIIDLYKLAYRLNELGLWEKYSEAGTPSISDFLNKNRNRLDANIIDFVKSISRRVLPSYYRNFSEGNVIKENIIDMLENRPFIPGSSLKGALRTAILNTMWGYDDNRLKLNNGFDVNNSSNFMQNILRTSVYGYSPSANTDIFKAVKVSDLFSNDENISAIYRVDTVNKTSTGRYSREIVGYEIYRECIKPNVTFAGTLIIDEYTAKKLNVRGIADVKGTIEKSQSFFKDNLIKEEERFHGVSNYFNEIKTGGANFRLGFGCGIENNTVIELLNDDNRMKVANTFKKLKNKGLFPVSKRIIMDGGKYWTMGWCKLEIG
ncbi:type III-A CRISPR-associated RAMP protein Csm5 [Calorimonas adulescens]|uniref:CRISPR system Cms protein Csm5 n=1 Tax=Calorimonas adulescens TaxID=2606906 RepID=A0A5D8QAH1_9THEO|nr:type III-A CRISPR-associated RAMP protein Csm5 [Calorimonas adulescens]TZE81600.1 type III-A CRISPR-associated RAMP protein Csm5 [Calorimonas adulescens]